MVNNSWSMEVTKSISIVIYNEMRDGLRPSFQGDIKVLVVFLAINIFVTVLLMAIN